MRSLLLFLMLVALPVAALADHITGGEIYYTAAASGNGSIQYHIIAKVFMRCNSGRAFNNPAIFSIFDKANGSRISDQEVALGRTETLSLTDPNKCITDPPEVCYIVGYYEFTVALPPSANGYTVAGQFVYRIAGIRNLAPFYSNVGATYTAEIPAAAGGAATNNSAQFVGSDLVAICANNSFSYSFAAKDADGDQLRYSFCAAYQGGVFRNGTSVPPSAPPYGPVPYNSEFSGGSPLGPNVHINAQTGLITGIAPADGIYVVTVCVDEIRNGKVIATQRKDLQIFIASCTIAAASLLPQYDLCRDSKTLTVANRSNSPLIRTYNWAVLDEQGHLLTEATTPDFTYSFSDTGTYHLKLTVNRDAECSDSNVSVVRVYPGLIPAFDVQGVCTNKPTNFFDRSTTVYGAISEWSWNLGDSEAAAGLLSNPSPSITYRSSGSHLVQLKVTTTLGCTDTVSKIITITDRPPLNLLFKDTTICKGDELQLLARSSGSYQWSPQEGVRSGTNTAAPQVAPGSTTLFVASLNQEGCINQDSVLVRVENGVQLQTGPDTTICTGDTISLQVQSNAKALTWQPAEAVLQQGLATTLVHPITPTRFEVTGKIGGCINSVTVMVTTVPYPFVNAGNDTVICFNTTALLRATTDGSRYSWSQPQTLDDPASLITTANPRSTTRYIFTAFSNQGCPKPAYDTVLVTVQPPVNAFAGHDTAVVAGQPLQLTASGGSIYEWTPLTGLSSGTVFNPVVLLPQGTGSIRYKVKVSTPEGCSDTASVVVRLFEAGPSLFVPTAFSPNGDGLNDVLKPIAAGMRQIEIFSVYNRWGQLLFSSRDAKGWDGTFNGQPQGSGVYVWMIRATDYRGQQFVQKGTVTLIR